MCIGALTRTYEGLLGVVSICRCLCTPTHHPHHPIETMVNEKHLESA